MVLSLVLGVILATHMKQNTQDYDLVSLRTIQVMNNDLNNHEKEISDLKKMIEKTKNDLEQFQQIINEDGDISVILGQEISNLKLISGLEDVQGPGIIIVISDNEDKEIIGNDVNDDIVHDSDMQMIINDLKRAGAEAISINGQRIVSSSEIKCGGPIIKVNGRSSANPFVIKAIGDPKVLYAAINAPNTTGWILREFYKIGVETTMWDNILISRYWGEPKFEYAKPVKEGE